MGGKVKRIYRQICTSNIYILRRDFEINNPLRSHAGINTIGGVYLLIPCLPPEYRLRIENIFLLALFNSVDRKTCQEGNDAVIKIIVDELNHVFREGITVEVKSKSIVVYVCLGLLLGYNEALNSSTGFVEGPNATYYCRICKMTKSENQRNYCIEEKHMRSPEQYLREGFQDSKNTGFKENPIWNLVDFFHVVFNYFLDIAHDLVEGVCKYAMKQLLYFLIFEKKWLNFNLLNENLKSFNYEKRV